MAYINEKRSSSIPLMLAFAGIALLAVSCRTAPKATTTDDLETRPSLVLKLYWDKQWHGRGGESEPELALEEQRIAQGKLIPVRARVEYRFWPFVDNPSLGGYRGAILQLLDGEKIPRYPQVRGILLISETPGISRLYLAENMIYTLTFSPNGEFYDLVDEQGQSGMFDPGIDSLSSDDTSKPSDDEEKNSVNWGNGKP